MLSALVVIKFPAVNAVLEGFLSGISDSLSIDTCGDFDTAKNVRSGHRFDIVIIDIYSCGGMDPLRVAEIQQCWPGAAKVFFDLEHDELAHRWIKAGGGRAYIPWTMSAESIQESLLAVVDGDESFPKGAEAGRSARLLTPRQADVLKHLEMGASNKEISQALGLAPGTVKIHVNAILRSLGVRNRTEAALHFRMKRKAYSAL